MEYKYHVFEGDTLTISEWVEKFQKLYKVSDEHRKPEEFWNAVMAHLSCIGESIRRNNYPELLDFAASAFCWMSTYLGKCNETDDIIFHSEHNLSEAVALKFPDHCGHCGSSPCTCKPAEIDAVSDKSATYKNLFRDWKKNLVSYKSYTLSDWLGSFHKIFGPRIHLQTMENLGFHLLEEAGEEAMPVIL